MNFSQKLQLIRKNKGYTQEELAGKLDVSRQAVAKWESGQVYPDISNLIQISKLFNVTVDYLVKDQECIVSCSDDKMSDINRLVEFRLEANRNTYAACMNETDSTRFNSHDFTYSMVLIPIMIHMLAGNSLPVKKPYGMKVNHSMQ